MYEYETDLVLNNLQWLICHKTKPNQTKPNKNKRNVLWHISLHGLFKAKAILFKDIDGTI